MTRTKTGTCCLCGERYTRYGNNPWPLSTVETDRCCRACDNERVIPERLRRFFADPPESSKPSNSLRPASSRHEGRRRVSAVKVGTRRGTKKWKPMAHQSLSECKVEFAEESGEIILYVEIGGKRIARRGPNKRWVSIEPGYIVRGCEPGNYEQLEIGYNPTKARPQ